MKLSILYGANDTYGASRALIGDVTALVAAGHTVHVTVPLKGPLTEKLLESGASVAIEPRLIVLRKSDLSDMMHFPDLRRVMAGADLVILWTLAMAVYAPLLRLRGQPFVFSVHELPSSRLEQLVIRASVRLADFVIANSDRTYAGLVSSGVKSHSMATMRPLAALDGLTRFPRHEADPKHVAVVGRVNGNKGHLQVAQVIKTLHGDDGGWRATFYGAPFPGQEDSLDELMTEIGSASYLHYAGEIRFMGEIDKSVGVIASFPSKPESFGLVPIEAAFCGIPTVGYGDGGAVSVYQHVGAFDCLRTDDPLRDIKNALEEFASSGSPSVPEELGHAILIENDAYARSRQWSSLLANLAMS